MKDDWYYARQLVNLYGAERISSYTRGIIKFDMLLIGFPYPWDDPFHSFGTDTMLQADIVESILKESWYGEMSISRAYENIHGRKLVVEIQFAP